MDKLLSTGRRYYRRRLLEMVIVLMLLLVWWVVGTAEVIQVSPFNKGLTEVAVCVTLFIVVFYLSRLMRLDQVSFVRMCVNEGCELRGGDAGSVYPSEVEAATVCAGCGRPVVLLNYQQWMCALPEAVVDPIPLKQVFYALNYHLELVIANRTRFVELLDEQITEVVAFLRTRQGDVVGDAFCIYDFEYRHFRIGFKQGFETHPLVVGKRAISIIKLDGVLAGTCTLLEELSLHVRGMENRGFS